METNFCDNAPSALAYRYYDNTSESWTEIGPRTPSLSRHCGTLFSNGPYKNLQFAVDPKWHTQNRVLAEKSSYSREIPLQECIAFGSLRADGEHTQWPNIKRELGASNLCFNSEAVYTLIVQAAWQVGSSGDTINKNSHEPLRCARFCNDLLRTLRVNIDTIEGNWDSHQTMALLIALLIRVLSLTNNKNVIEIGIQTLQRCRTVAFAWTDWLSKILRRTTDISRGRDVQLTLLKVALLAKMTYDVDDKKINLLLRNRLDVEHWLRVSIVVMIIPGEQLCYKLYICSACF